MGRMESDNVENGKMTQCRRASGVVGNIGQKPLGQHMRCYVEGRVINGDEWSVINGRRKAKGSPKPQIRGLTEEVWAK